MDFPQAWRRVEELAGEHFQTESGQDFTYRFRGTYIVVSPGEQSVSRTNFRKVFERKRGAAVRPQPVQGQRYILAIYGDERFSLKF